MILDIMFVGLLLSTFFIFETYDFIGPIQKIEATLLLIL